MKIDERNAVNLQKSQPGRMDDISQSSNRKAVGQTRSAQGSDQIEVNTQAQLQSLALGVGGDQQSARVEELRALVNSGQYKVDYTALSGAMVSAMLRGIA